MIEKDIVLKTWEIYQGLIQNLGETCGKIRSLFYTVASAIIGYGFVHRVPFLYAIAAVLAVVFFVLEGGYKQIQNQYIVKSAEIERTLNDLIVGEEEPFIPQGGIKTAIKTATGRGIWRLLRLRNWLFWGPYFFVIACALVLAFSRAGAEQSAKDCTKLTQGIRPTAR